VINSGEEPCAMATPKPMKNLPAIRIVIQNTVHENRKTGRYFRNIQELRGSVVSS
jgi:hypothetical protein